MPNVIFSDCRWLPVTNLTAAEGVAECEREAAKLRQRLGLESATV